MGLFDSGCLTVTILGRVSGGIIVVVIVVFSLCGVKLSTLLLGKLPPPPLFTDRLLPLALADVSDVPPPPPPPKQWVTSDGLLPLFSICPVDDSDVFDAVAPAEEHKFIILPSLAVAGDNMLPRTRSMSKRQQRRRRVQLQRPQPMKLVASVCNV